MSRSGAIWFEMFNAMGSRSDNKEGTAGKITIQPRVKAPRRNLGSITRGRESKLLHRWELLKARAVNNYH